MALPFQADAFDASLAILTVHHWPDKARGLRELRRVSRDRVVILSWDPTYAGCFWLTEYIPQIADEVRRIFPMLHEYEPELGPVEVIDVRIPHDCIDGFMGAYWRRPEAYLNQRVRAAISTFAKIGDVTLGLTRLDRDLKSGEWNRRDGDILTGAEMSLGYRLIIAK